VDGGSRPQRRAAFAQMEPCVSADRAVIANRFLPFASKSASVGLSGPDARLKHLDFMDVRMVLFTVGHPF
jgi:hypothetical protein